MDIAIDDQLRAAQGEKVFGYFKIGEEPLSPINWPIGIVNGKREGPRLFIVAGTHPCEYAGIEAAVRIFKNTDPISLRGSIVCIPVFNPVGFERRTSFFNPIDDINPGFIFPGDSSGSMSYRMASIVLNIASKCEFVLDLHGGDTPEHLFPFSIVETVGKETVDSMSFELAKLFGAPYIVQRTPSHQGTLEYQAALKGIPGVVGEAGSLGILDEADVQVHVTGVTNIMRHLKMIDGETTHFNNLKVLRDGWKVRANHGGLFHPKVKPGDIVKKEQLLAEIMDLKGDIVEAVTSPKDGLILYTTLRHATNTGDPLFSMSTPLPI
jgi:predicted deacylase